MRVSAIQTHRGMFALASLEPLAAMKDWWQLQQDMPESVESLFVKPIITVLAEVAGEAMSGLVLDPRIGLSVAVSGDNGILLPLNQQHSAEVDPLALPHIDSQWGVVEIANNYGVAKLTLYYHPAEAQATQKKQMVAELADYCRYEHIDLVLDLVIYTPAGEEFSISSFQAAQLQAIQEFRSLPQLMILQYPLDPLACATLTTELDIPWVVSSRGLRYPEFKETLRTALEGGAKGFFLYELSWPKVEVTVEELELQLSHLSGVEKFDGAQLNDLKTLASNWIDNCKQEIATTLRDQMLELTRITNEFGE